MLKKVITLLTFLVTYTYSFPQAMEESSQKTSESISPHRLSFNVGLAVPNGEFAESNINDRQSGFAENGKAFKFNYAYFFAENVGFTVDFTRTNFKLAKDELNDYTIAQAQTFATNVFYSVSSYSLNQFTLGLIFRVGDKVSLYANPVIGYSSLKFPRERIEGITKAGNNQGLPPNIQFETVTDSPNDEKLFYAINVGIDIPITNNIFFNLNAQYYSLDYDQNLTATTRLDGGASGQGSINLMASQNVSAIQIGGGITHRF